MRPRGSAISLPALSRNYGTIVLVGSVSTLTAVALFASGGNLVATLAPVGLATFLFVLAKAPLKGSATVLVFALLAMEVSSDAEGFVHTPLVAFGDFLNGDGKLLAPYEALLLALLGVGLYRLANPPAGARRGWSAPRPVRDVLIAYFLALAFAEVVGLASGYGFAPWKVRYIVHPVLFFLLFHLAFPAARDFRPVAVAVVIAAEVKAVIAVWVQRVAGPAATGGQLGYATNHGDSVLFVTAIMILLLPLLETRSRKALLRAAVCMPLLFWAISLNHRRIAYGMMEISLAVIFLFSPPIRWKRAVTRMALIGAPILALYVGMGWNSQGGGLFGPVQKVRTMVDSKDPSTYWREVEAWNIATTLRTRPIIGTGFGGEYKETMFNDSIADGYAGYREWPHNTLLGMLLYAGTFGFVGLWLPTLATVFLLARTIRTTSNPYLRTAALACLPAVVCVAFMAWGDTGTHFIQSKIAVGLTLALAGKLALESGGWPLTGRG